MKIAGKIIPLPRGEYSPSTTYAILDMVTLENRLYMLKVKSSVGVDPTDTSKWMLLIDGKTAQDALETEVDLKIESIDQQMTTWTETMTSWAEAIERMTTTVSSCDQSVSKCLTTVTNLKDEVNGLTFTVDSETGNLEYNKLSVEIPEEETPEETLENTEE